MKKSQASVTIKTEHFAKAMQSKKYQALKDERLSIEKAQENHVVPVESLDDLYDLSDLIGLLNELSNRNLDLVDSITIPLEQLKIMESFLV